ncbi:hypothetical protein K456DRAFT_424429 [Colletotrichum gloeosporioides 23]|nr:hypothetical protein K456DRAFT_424429 [Colletotrichum gloeosporioides 23]
MAHSYLAYIRLKAVISTLRYFDGEKPAPAQPDEVFTITGRDGKRGIRVHVYRPESPTTPSPVLINWNGVARHTPFTVLDASYALAPEEPFPAAVEDALDVVAHVFSRRGEYDVGRVVLCGFSSGGNLALAASQCAAGGNGKVRGVVAFYPPTEMRTHPAEKRMLDGSLEDMPAVRRGTFPRDVVVITAERDRLAAEAERFAAGIGGGGRRVVLKRCEGVGHGFDKMEREEAYGVVVEFLRGLVGEREEGGC